MLPSAARGSVTSWASGAIAAIERLAREHGLGVVVSGTNDRQKPDAGWIEGVLNRRPVGVILIVSALPPCSSSSSTHATLPSSCWIQPDNRLPACRRSALRIGAAPTPRPGN